MQVLSDRVSILQKEDLVSVVILAGNDRRKQALLFTWLLAWSVCGVIVLANYFSAKTSDQKVFIIVYLAFWIYFEVSIVRGFMWRRWGKEKIWIQNGLLHYQREIQGRGKIKEWETSLLSKIELVELKPERWSDTLNQSYWMKAGERLQFTSQGRTHRFGMQLSDDEARTIRKELNKLIK